MKKQRIIMPLLLALVMVFSFIPFTAVAATMQEPGALNLDMPLEEASERGFQIIDGDIYSMHGELLIQLDENGLTQDGLMLSDNFQIIYGGTPTVEFDGPLASFQAATSIRGADIAIGTFRVTRNRGTATVPLGGRFTLCATFPSVSINYQFGVVTGVNFSVVNVTANRVEAFATNVTVGRNVLFANIFHPANPSHQFELRASGETGAGNITVHAYSTFTGIR